MDFIYKKMCNAFLPQLSDHIYKPVCGKKQVIQTHIKRFGRVKILFDILQQQGGFSGSSGSNHSKKPIVPINLRHQVTNKIGFRSLQTISV
jgi:hypothetical protein